MEKKQLPWYNYKKSGKMTIYMNLSFIIPCYNEEGNIEKFYEETEKVFSGKGIQYEYVFINDGSTDSTKDKLKNLFESKPFSNITVVNFSRNFGKEAGIYAGLKNATGDYVCVIDADLQQRPETAMKMFRHLAENPECDCVCAFQKQRKENKFISFLKSAYYKSINALAETEFRNGASDFRMFKAKVKNAVLSLGEYHRFSKGLFSWVGFDVCYMEYEAEERNSGSTKWSLRNLLRYGLSGILAFSTAPLKLSIYIGTIATLFSVIYTIVTLVRKITADISVDGFTQIVILITFFSGVLLFTVGIIGEYIARIYQQSKNRPIYIEDEVWKRK